MPKDELPNLPLLSALSRIDDAMQEHRSNMHIAATHTALGRLDLYAKRCRKIAKDLRAAAAADEAARVALEGAA